MYHFFPQIFKKIVLQVMACITLLFKIALFKCLYHWHITPLKTGTVEV